MIKKTVIKKTLHFRALEIHFNAKVALLIFIALCLLLNLGFWQLRRAEQRQHFNDELKRLQRAAPVPAVDLLSGEVPAVTGLKVSLQGRYLNNRSILIDNQVFRGQYGVEVLTPVKLTTTDTLVLVSRGWLAKPHSKRVDIPAIIADTPEPQQLLAEVFVPPDKVFFERESVDTKQWPIYLHHFDLATVEAALNQEISPFIARLDEGADGVFARHWKSRRLDPGINSRYALQWFGMAVLLLVAVLLISTNIAQLLHARFSEPE